ncbi:Amidohydrolase family protein [Brevibacterium linens]|uniref:Amidohydrolase family protein n=2 Tax=Brevibacterium linens TaxID=1703 RepID=A0A2H1KM26_BRELN|nr:Amidohydrolase family protein [Brevibacterium linens]
MPAHTGHVAPNQIAADVEAATQKGAIGVKILGGHFPSTPEATERIIEESTQRGLYTAFHAGTTRYGSNLDGMVEALELAAGRPLHLAHTNAYLRGAVRDLMDENIRSLTLLQENPRVVTESHLAPLNVAFGDFEDDLPTDHIARNCLALEGYEISESGVRSAIGAGRAYVHTSHSPDPVTGQAAQEDWTPQAAPMLSFAVNRRLTAYLQATARLSATGKLVFEGPGTFLVDAISSDGGGWRNLILDQGILLVQFGAMSWQQLAHKTSLRPAQLFGLYDKGKLIPGADADIIVVDAAKRSVETTIAAGKIIAEKGRSISSGGVVFTTADGADHLRQRHIPFRIHDLSNSVFMTKGTS